MRRLGLAVLIGVGTNASSAPSELSARLTCQRRPTPGRVVCEAELEVDSGVLSWGDVLVLDAPAFAMPLRSRVGQSAVVMQTVRRQRLQLALATTDAGEGTLKVRTRAVVCPDATGQGCRAAVREAEALVSVGPITE
jgi:hypothetical protein